MSCPLRDDNKADENYIFIGGNTGLHVDTVIAMLEEINGIFVVKTH